MLAQIGQAVLDHFSAHVQNCTSGVPTPTDCELEEIYTIGQPRGAGDELCVWVNGVSPTDQRDGRPVVRTYRFGVQVLRTGYPTIDADRVKPSKEDIDAVMPYFDGLGRALLAGARDFGEAFQCDVVIGQLVPQGPSGGQTGWRITLDATNPKVV
jgi:hypothetical protein